MGVEEVKSPIGLVPRKVHEGMRMAAIVLAMDRYVSHGERIPDEWISELIELNSDDEGGDR